MGWRREGQGMWHPELVEGPKVKDNRIFEAMTGLPQKALQQSPNRGPTAFPA
jgi:hypothetical protein